MKKRLIIGDIHGCFEELKELLDIAAVGEDDEIIAMGDIVDRGPHTPEVFEFISSRANTSSLMGNHERKHIRSFNGEIASSLSQRISRFQFGEGAYPTIIAEMETFPLYLDLPEALLVHGAYDHRLQLEGQQINVLTGAMSGTDYLKQTLPGNWFEFYEGPKPLIVGHHNHGGNFEPFIWRDLVYFLDTGCVRGGRLTAIMLPDFRIISVKAHESYWVGMKAWFSPTLKQHGDFSAYPSLQEGELCLKKLYDYVVAEHEKIMVQLENNDEYHALPPKRQVQEYAKSVRNNPLRACFHRLRCGKLAQAGIRNVIRTPGNAEAMIVALGI